MTFPQTVINGDAIVVAVSSWNSSSTANVTSITDSQGNTYTKLAEVNSVEPLSVWIAQNVTGSSSLKVTVSSTGASEFTVALHEYTGMVSASVVDKVVQSSGSNTAGLVTLSSSTNQPSEVLFSTFNHTSNFSPVLATASTGYTVRQSQTNNSLFEDLYTEDRVVSASGQYQAGVTFNHSVSWQGILISLKGQ